MRKIVGPITCPGERAHDVIAIVMLEHGWSLSFKAEILVTVVTNCGHKLNPSLPHVSKIVHYQ